MNMHTKKNGQTIRMSAPILADIENLADQMLIIRNGKRRDQGTKDEIITRYSESGDLSTALINALKEE